MPVNFTGKLFNLWRSHSEGYIPSDFLKTKIFFKKTFSPNLLIFNKS